MQVRRCANHQAGTGSLPAEPSTSSSPPQPGEVKSTLFTPANFSFSGGPAHQQGEGLSDHREHYT